MKITLEYDNGEVKAIRTDSNSGNPPELIEQGLSSSFSRYYQKMRVVFEKEMRKLSREYGSQRLDSKLKIELQLKGK